MPLKPVLGIGACLDGQAVRYDGQTKTPNPHVRALAKNFDLRPFCPEMAAGLRAPRPPIHLVGEEDGVRALDVASHSRDLTDKLAAHACEVLSMAPELCGYVLVSGSPSCGNYGVKRYAPAGSLLAADQQGVFAAALGKADPLLPVEDDERLEDPELRESFLTRACTYHDWKLLVGEALSTHRLQSFYSRYKYLVMAHNTEAYKRLGPLLVNAGAGDLDLLAKEFISGLMSALKHRASRGSRSNALQHMAGYLKRSISSPERQQLATLIDQYRTGKVALAVPVARIKHHLREYPDPYLQAQVFLTRHPDYV